MFHLKTQICTTCPDCHFEWQHKSVPPSLHITFMDDTSSERVKVTGCFVIFQMDTYAN